MLSHYVESIRQHGTPDGYNTEAPEYLNEYYGIEPRREPATTAIYIADEEGTYQPEDHHNDEMAWQEDEDIGEHEAEEGDEVEGPRLATAAPDANRVHHPCPELALAIRPTREATLPQLVDEYGATSLEQALKVFLRPYARGRWFILASDLFHVWHKLTLYHYPLPFAPDEPQQRDVIRARPRARGTQNRPLQRREPAFDTALYLHDSRQFGLHCYRAGRVRVIFQLPDRLQNIYPGELALLELFSPFNLNPAPQHLLHATSHHMSGGARRCLVVPVEDIVLGCHLAPNYRHIPPNVSLDANVDLLSDTRRFFFNHYYNMYTFQLIQYWRHHHELDA